MRIALTLVLLAACRPKASPIPDAAPDVAIAPDAGPTASYPVFADKAVEFRGFDDVKGTAIVHFDGGSCTIAPDDSAKCTWLGEGSIPLEHDDGAPQLVWKDGALAGAAPIAVPSFLWGRAFANGRIVFVDTAGKVFEIKKGAAVETKQEFPTRQGSTRFVDGWALWKDTSGEGDARVMAQNLADAAAKPIVLGKTKRPSGIRRYDTCATDDRYVSMDPNLVVRSKGKWTMVPLEYGRRIVCAGDHAILSDAPLRCDPSGCRPHAYTGKAPDAGLGELFLSGQLIEHQESEGADDVWFELEHFDAVKLTVVPNGETYREVSIAGEGVFDRDETWLHVVAGRALVLARRKADKRYSVISVDRRGALKSVVGQ